MTTARDRVIAKISETADKTQAARSRKQSKGNATGYMSVWNDAVMDEYGKDYCIAPTIKTSGMFKKALARLPNQNVGHLQLFIQWVVETWARHRTLVGKAKYPEQPDITTFVFLVDKLYFAYCRKEQTSVRSKPLEKAPKIDGEVGALKATIAKLTRELAEANEKVRALNQQIRMIKEKK